MKGFILYEDYRGKKVVEAIKLGMVNYECKSDTSDDCWVNTLSGIRKESTQACCNESDTYDFETGALIALMKMCGFDKSYKAIEEAFKYNSYDAKKSKELEKNVIIGGRQNGKQYTLLVDLFKKLDQKKVDAAYKEAYNTILPLWQKEVLRQMYEIRKESKESDYLASLLDSNKYTMPYVDKWFYKIPTKRDEMWTNILNCKDDTFTVKVRREDAHEFLKELESIIPDVKWAGGGFKPTEWCGFYNWDNEADICYMIVRKRRRLTYEWRNLTNAINAKHFDYLPPMRWDLFKKGRIVVGVRKEQYDEFISNATEHIYRCNEHKPYDNFDYSFFIYDKYANFIEAIGRSQFRAIKEMNNHKVVYWEDVR